jgi:hypothetical protein
MKAKGKRQMAKGKSAAGFAGVYSCFLPWSF